MAALLPLGIDPNTTPLLSPPEGVQPNFDNPPSIDRTAIGVISLLLIFQVLFLLIRLHVNFNNFHTLKADDWMAVAGFVLSVGLATCLLYMRHFARHFWNIPIAWFTPDIQKVIFAEEMIIGPATFAGKSALLLMYYRIFSPSRSFRWTVYITMVFCFLTQVILVPTDAILCVPKENWTIPNPNCNKSFAIGLVSGPGGVIVDLIAFYLPIPMVISLQMPLKRKIGVLAIFTTGVAAIVASAFNLYARIYMFLNIDSGYAGYISTFCSFVETAIGVICSSMPAMTSVKKYVGDLPSLASMRSRLLSYGSGGSLRNRKSAFDTASKDSHSSGLYLRGDRPGDSLPRFNEDGYIQMDGFSFPEGRPEAHIAVDHSQRDQSRKGIQKSVMVEQSSIA